jgi:ribonuclease HI
MELKAIIETLIYCKHYHIESPTIVTDSKFCISVCTAWLWLWLKEDRIDKMKNPDLSHDLIPLLNSVKPKFEWVK